MGHGVVARRHMNQSATEPLIPEIIEKNASGNNPQSAEPKRLGARRSILLADVCAGGSGR